MSKIYWVTVIMFLALAGCRTVENSTEALEDGGETEQESDPGVGPKSDTGSAADLDRDTDADGDADGDADTDTDTETDAGGDGDGDTDTDAGADSDTVAVVHDCPEPTGILALLSGEMLDAMAVDEDYFYFVSPSSRDRFVEEPDNGGDPVITYGPWLAQVIWVSKKEGVVQTGAVETREPVNRVDVENELLYLYQYDRLSSEPGLVFSVPRFGGELQDDPLAFEQPVSRVQVDGNEIFFSSDTEAGLESMNMDTGEWTRWSEDAVSQFHVGREYLFWVAEGDTGDDQIWRKPRQGGEAEVIASGPFENIRFDENHILFWTRGGAEGHAIFSFVWTDDVVGLLWLDQEVLSMPGRIESSAVTLTPDDAVTIAGDSAYVSNSKGELWRIPLESTGPSPALLETWGPFDDDDYDPWIYADEDAVYWLAGPETGVRVSDDDEIALLKTCLGVDGTPDTDLAIDPLLEALSGAGFVLEVDRIADHPDSVTFPFDPLDESAYVPVENGTLYDLSFSGDGTSVSILGTTSEEPMIGYRSRLETDVVEYDLQEGLFAGGRLVVWVDEDRLAAELTIYGSGMPIIQSERGELSPTNPL